ncbi:phosphoribosylglycinamide formyltransferase [Clostridium sp. YIM B02515]|uniref:Phosphoribosylglycinamide formyltransferase n=1 Tax=Clostridium rhizosphaerae TaxID=2803861 RepID=A0ABS1TA68_9CLOT|nr:phosphoribosylglycinamide formyltransferase [Clostridium rhizosphaerae]MBL4936220.1 phosphoribosylglycinamide formyltransferase [Clostridium rhizosphaerae]
MLKIAVLISGNGSNLQAILDSIDSGILKCSVEMVISDRKEAYGLERAKQRNIKTYIVNRSEKNISREILELTLGKVQLIVLAGFLSILKGEIIEKFRNRIINIHPSLIPAFCGKGMYGVKVHEAAVSYGVKYSGCTVHFVDEGTDSGAIICQKTVPVYNEDTAETLQKRVLVEEHKLLPKAINYFAEDKIRSEGRKVFVIEE